MKVTPKEIENVLGLLVETPGRITSAVESLDDERLHLRPEARTWSANDTLAHLRACADVWGETIATMLQEDEPTLKRVSPRTWLKKTDYLELPFQESFRDFVDQRRALLQMLRDLTFNDWKRRALIKDRQHTVFSQARRMALHEMTHCEQLEALGDSLQARS
jgi:uncharacterized damage-inducible protein DinB